MYPQHIRAGPAPAYGAHVYGAQAHAASAYGLPVACSAPAVYGTSGPFGPTAIPAQSAQYFSLQQQRSPFASTVSLATNYQPRASSAQAVVAPTRVTNGSAQTNVAPARVTNGRAVVINAADEAAQAAATIQATGSDAAFVEQKLRQQNVLVLFSKTYCPFVIKAKEVLNALRPLPVMDVIELDVMGQPRHGPIQQALRSKTGSSTVPQAFVNGSYIGGCQEIDNLHRRGELLSTLQRLGCRFN